MRLTILDRGHRWRPRLFIGALSRLSRVEMSDVPKTLLYRPESFGRAMLDLSAEAMRGPSYWSAGEREYLATFTARLHRSPYCVTTHTELTRIASGGAIDAGDPGSVRPELRAVLPFIESVTRAPALVRAGDLPPVRAAGVPDRAIVEALHVNLVFNVISRLANAFGFTLREGQLVAGTRSLHRFGYRFPRFVTGGRRVTAADAIERLRHAAGSPPAALRPYARMVRDESYRVSDAGVTRLLAAGHSEDELFEVTVGAALGAALHSLDAGLAAVFPTNQGGEFMTTKPNPIPDSYRRVTPCLIVNGGAAAIEFYTEVFGATERMRFPGPDGTIAHAELQIGDSVVMIEDASPDQGTNAPPAGGSGSSLLYIYVEDVDETMDRAVKLGAKVVRGAEDQFYGDRDGYLIDPFGHGWTVASHVEDVPPEEMARRMAELPG